MLSLCICALLAAAPPPPVELKAGAAEPGDEVILHVSGLAAPAHEKAGLYLFGKLSVPSHPLRALLLRSTDGGAHWTEVLPDVEHSEVLFVEFEGCQGRALVGWSTEGPGELKLLASSDCGATWKRRSTLPKAVWSEWPEQMEWTDGQRGTVWLSDANEENAPVRAITTRDGGKTWSTPKQPPRQPPSATASESLGPTGVRWKVSSDEQGTKVERQEPEGATQVRALLPVAWRREGNKLVPAR
ncbi:WD40/YVTN/BNR-like repeat-containing protein [Archangium lansingense]|uniref:Sialidase family protein n=1 Tax=Archangium lansingense TaxID=2995310 RepID=A0ABT4A7E0_9BACT|nr:sialidase family protein [Archangium lansinium]MCY1077565.1 sialidase family protein [Archangium lansinium]